LFEAGAGQQTEHRAAIAESRNIFARAEQQRSAVSAIDVVQQSRRGVEVPPEQAGEPLLRGTLAQQPIELFRGRLVTGSGTSPVRGMRRPLNEAGQHRSGNILPGHVADYEGRARLRKVEGVVEIAADIRGWPPLGRDLKIARRGVGRREQPALHLARDLHLAFYTPRGKMGAKAYCQYN